MHIIIIFYCYCNKCYYICITIRKVIAATHKMLYANIQNYCKREK